MLAPMGHSKCRSNVRALTAVAMVGAIMLSACAPDTDSSPPATEPAKPASATTLPPLTTTTAVTPTSHTSVAQRPSVVDEYRPDLEARLFLPTTATEAPLVVMVPGGGWRTADPTGLESLAGFLADSGAIAVTIEVSAAIDRARYPAPLDDIRCAVAFGLARAEDAGFSPGPVVLLGHSSGAHLAALVALGSEGSPPECHEGPVDIAALVGLAGVYDVTRLPALAFLLFGVTPEEDPDLWDEGNPLLRAHLNPEMPVLLLHGDADRLVPLSFTDDFALALIDAGHDTTITMVPGADHSEITLTEVSGAVIAAWIEGL